MKQNTFILTTGLSGSSVVTGLLKQAGLWCGSETEYKDNSTGRYETYENSEFVALNNRLVESYGQSFDSKSWYDLSLRDQLTQLVKTINLSDYKQFVKECGVNEPWVLKDPKLWITIGFWTELFKEYEFNTIVLSRDVNKLWLSQTNKRIIYDFNYLKESESKSKASLIEFLEVKNIPIMDLVYDDLIDNPQTHLLKINSFLNTQLSLSDWWSIFNTNKQSSSSLLSIIKAKLIYFKNYSSRIR